MKNKRLSHIPTITVVMATFNSRNTIQKCLQSIRSQEYPQDKINILLSDGGSTDGTLDLVRKYDVTVISIPRDKQNAEYNKGVAIRQAKGNLLLMVDHDNVLPHNKWLSNMVVPLMDNKELVAVETLRYHYDPMASLLDRYFALFGAGDPLAYYLGKADRLSYLSDTYNLLGKWKDMGAYYVVLFDSNKIPTLGANGFLIRRKILIENAMVDKNHFFHIDVNVDLIRKGYNKFAFIKDDIIHLTGYKDISNFLYRRKLFMEQFHFTEHKTRRYSVYMPQDRLNLLKYIVYSITFVKPTFDAMRGYLKIRDTAWFLHPVLCFSLLLIYGFVTIRQTIMTYGK